jgi:hypothetical protein
MSRRTGRTRALPLVGLALAIAGIAAVPAPAAMQSTRIGKHLCKTIGGGRFVKIPGFPGERIDRRLLKDIRWMRNHYKIFITDGYSTDPIHARNGEHPIGLAADIVPDRSEGGTWRLIGKLAKRFEPEQNHVRMPFRWIGYNGDPNHGRGNHLHLSWAHSRKTRFGHPVRKVFTRICPEDPDGGDGGGGSGGTGDSGGTKPPKSGWPGLSERERANLAPAVAERY